MQNPLPTTPPEQKAILSDVVYTPSSSDTDDNDEHEILLPAPKLLALMAPKPATAVKIVDETAQPVNAKVKVVAKNKDAKVSRYGRRIVAPQRLNMNL